MSRRFNQINGSVLVTHDQQLAASMERVITLRDGRIGSDQLTSSSYEVSGDQR